MAPPSLGTPRARPNFKIESDALPVWAHPEVKFWYDEWRTIRDMCEGERVVKDEGNRYLPMLEGMDNDEYQSYVERATFYPFTGRTASALSGSIFRRRETFEGLNEKFEPALETITRNGKPFLMFATYIAEEVIKLGRVGVLLDMPADESTTPRPYLTDYTAENIIDWDEAEIDGRLQLVRVVLREPRTIVNPVTGEKTMTAQYRQLKLTSTGRDREYIQEVFATDDITKSILLTDAFKVSTIFPRVRGRALNYIPFYVFGSFESGLSIDKAPMQDIARLNVSHYRSYAHLEHGRFFTGFPIYYVEAPVGSSESEAEFQVGASRVWTTPAGAKPGILEMNGQGLKFLVDALDIKENQAAALGGRMMGVRTTAVSESDNMLKLSERNEQSVLLKITRSLDVGFTQVMRWWLTFLDITKEEAAKVSVEFNKDFLFDGIGAREFRAIHSMYKDGVLPIEVCFHYMKKAMVVPDWMTLEEFKKLLDKPDSFPNNADVEARREGFADAKSRDQEDLLVLEKELDGENDQAARDDAATEADKQRKADEKAAKEDRKSAEKVAKNTPKVASVAGKPGTVPAKKPAGPTK